MVQSLPPRLQRVLGNSFSASISSTMGLRSSTYTGLGKGAGSSHGRYQEGNWYPDRLRHAHDPLVMLAAWALRRAVKFQENQGASVLRDKHSDSFACITLPTPCLAHIFRGLLCHHCTPLKLANIFTLTCCFWLASSYVGHVISLRRNSKACRWFSSVLNLSWSQ